MAETAAHRVDKVIPRVPVRQWVLSFPIRLRILFAAHPELLTPVLRIILKTRAALRSMAGDPARPALARSGHIAST
jgi:hypothetical protein